MREDLQIDAGLIHLADAQCAEIVEPLDDLATRTRTRAELLDLSVLVMFFERDDVGLLCHSCPPSHASRAQPLVVRSTASGALPAEYSGSALVVDSFPIFRRDQKAEANALATPTLPPPRLPVISKIGASGRKTPRLFPIPSSEPGSAIEAPITVRRDNLAASRESSPERDTKRGPAALLLLA